MRLGLNPADRDACCRCCGRALGRMPRFSMPGAMARSTGRRRGRAPRRGGDDAAGDNSLLPAARRGIGAALDLPWSLEIIGDGPARAEVEIALATLGSRVSYRGALDDPAIAAALADADLCVWPAINEAFGMALLEAQASGVAVVAGRSGGVAGIVVPGETGLLVPPGDAAAFAAAVRRLILDGEACAAMGAAARAKVEREHDLPVAAVRLAAALEPLSGRVRAA